MKLMLLYQTMGENQLNALLGQLSYLQSHAQRLQSLSSLQGTGTTLRNPCTTSYRERGFWTTTDGSLLESGLRGFYRMATKGIQKLRWRRSRMKSTLSPEAQERKDTPVFSGVMAYFPDAIKAVAKVSKAGNDQHNPSQPLHWDRSKSTDEYDACQRHLLDRAEGVEFDTDGQRHMAKVAWRALAALQKEIENEQINEG